MTTKNAPACKNPEESPNALIFGIDFSAPSSGLSPVLQFVRGLGDVEVFKDIEIPFDDSIAEMSDEDRLETIGDAVAQELVSNSLLKEGVRQDILVLDENNIERLSMLSDFAVSLLKGTPDWQEYDRAGSYISDDRQEIIVRAVGGVGRMFVSVTADDEISVFSIYEDAFYVNESFETEDGEPLATVTMLNIVPEWVGKDTELTFNKLAETFGDDGDESASIELVDAWLFDALSPRLGDRFVSENDCWDYREARMTACPVYAAGNEEEVQRLLSIAAAIDFRALPLEIDFRLQAWDADILDTADADFLHQAVKSGKRDRQKLSLFTAWNGRPAEIRNHLPVSKRGKTFFQEIAAWANPRGVAIMGYGTNRASSVQWGPIISEFEFHLEEFGTGHAYVTAIKEMTDFLKMRGYSAEEIEDLLKPDAAGKVRPGQ